MTKTCEQCGREFHVKPSRTKARFCSKACYGPTVAARNAQRRPAHGHAAAESREYRSWTAMISRCYRASSGNYHKYGARGVNVCDRWRNSFAAFLEDMGPRPPGTSLDRIDGRGHYEPGNCRWATVIEQRHNRVSP